MTDLAILNATVKGAMRDVAKQASALATGLQNAGPGDKSGQPNNSVQYLQAISDHLLKVIEECDKVTGASPDS